MQRVRISEVASVVAKYGAIAVIVTSLLVGTALYSSLYFEPSGHANNVNSSATTTATSTVATSSSFSITNSYSSTGLLTQSQSTNQSSTTQTTSYPSTSTYNSAKTETDSQSTTVSSSTIATTTSTSSTITSSSSSTSTSSQSQGLNTIPIPGSDPYYIAYDTSNGYLYAIDFDSGNISIVNPATDSVNTLVLSRYNTFWGITYDSSNNLFYIAEASSGNAQQPSLNGSVIALNPLTDEVVANVTVGVWPFGAAFVPANGDIYVTTWNTPNARGTYGPGTISVIDGNTNTILKNITVGSQPVPLVFDNSNGNLYVGNEYSSSLSVINVTVNTVIDTITLPAIPDGLAYDSSNNNIYVSGGVGSDYVYVISSLTNTLVANITLPDSGLEGIAFNPSNGYVYVATGYGGFGPGAISIINGATNKIVTNITVGVWPVGVTYDNSNGYIYVANAQGPGVSALS